MNKERFQELITRPEKIEDADLVQLQQVVRDFPYFHNAHLLLLYGLYKQKSEKFNDQLKQSSLYLSNRSFFVSAIFQGWQNRTAEVVPELKLTDVIVPEPVIEELSADPSERKAEILIEENPEETVREVILEVEPTVVTHPENEPELKPEPVMEVTSEDSFTFSFEDNQVVDIADKKDFEVAGKQEATTDLLELDMSQSKDDEPSDDLIDHFLKVNPRIVPKIDLEDSRGDISQPGLEENDEIVTETLAAIYEQQGHFLKAKDAFQKLILKFPEKSTYFASRIQELEKRIK